MPADPSERPVFEPDAVAGKSFTQARRGYEPDEVRAFLLSVASQIRDAKLRYEDMERRLVEVERRAADPRDLDETAVTQLLGEETARVLETARNAAADIRNRAEAEADDARLADIFGKAGVGVHDIPPAEMAKWRELARGTAWKDFAERSPATAALMRMAEAIA